MLVYYTSSKQNEANEWLKATVVKADEQMEICRKEKRGAPMTVAYEDVRLLPKHEINQEIMRKEVADEDYEYHLSSLVRASEKTPVHNRLLTIREARDSVTIRAEMIIQNTML